MHINSMVVANLVLQSCSVPRLVLSYARAVCIASHISPTTTSVEVDRIHLHKKQKVVVCLACFSELPQPSGVLTASTAVLPGC